VAALDQHAVDLLRRLIRIDTVNPPGAERPAAELVATELRDAGFDDVQLLGRTPERPNVVARLRGHADGPVLGLLSHLDTVLADPAEWRRDPWSGDLVDGEVWGRGAQDMLSQTAAEVAAACSLARSGWRPARGDLLVLAVADEETGGGEGAIWLCEHHPDLVRCDMLLNEGAGSRFELAGRRAFGVCIAEKGVFRFTVTTRGAAGHASMPGVADNALPKLAPVLAALGDGRPAFDLTEAPRALFAAAGIDVDGDVPAAVAALRAGHPQLADFVEPMLSVTFAPTVVSASSKINVIPARAEVRVDCRVPPGLGEETTRERLAEVLPPGAYEIEFIERTVGNASPAASPLMDAIAGWLGREEPGAAVVPVMLPAFTDSRTFRDAFPECVAYGFFPQRERSLFEMWTLVHGKDERIAAADVGWAARAYRDIATEVLA
jgi:acetylornithine deacetylase/succinyl-diaminopimelate desuccinylase-like protein